MLEIKYIVFLIACLTITSFVEYGLCCHAGHQHGDGEEDDQNDCVSQELEGEGGEEVIVLVFEEEEEGEEDLSECERKKRRRRKRSLAAQESGEIVKNYARLRKYFRDCLSHVERDIIWDWQTVVDFSILDTIWFEDTENEVCVDRDNVDCWKEMVDEYLLEDSPRRDSTKLCIQRYSEDIKNNKGEFNASAVVISAPNSPRKRRDVPYYWQMTEEQLKEEYARCVQEYTTGNLPYRKDQSFDSLLKFVNQDIKCGRCDYNNIVISVFQRRKREAYEAYAYSYFTYAFETGTTVPTTTKPDRSDEIRALIRSRYRVEWPFTLQALTKQNASISRAFERCNKKFDREFQRPPPRLPWAEWGKWTECKATCDKVGIQFRLRYCDAGDGRCPGKSTETKECYASGCATWGRWTSYTSCSVTCGIGKQSSFRTCSIPDKCIGSPERSKICGKKVCYGPWTPWSHCTPYCGKRRQYSYKFCTQSSMEDKCSDLGNMTKIVRMKSCPNMPCYSAWSPYSECTVTCGKGVMISRRHCVHPEEVPCPSNQLNKDVQCVRRPCMAEWANWNEWSSCNLQRRTRNCLNGIPGDGHCIGDKETLRVCQGCESNYPSTTPYPINYENSGLEWSSWDRWSDCSVTCGVGTTQRKRISAACRSGPRTDNRSGPTTKCEGMATESRTCNPQKCPEHDDPSAGNLCTDIAQDERCRGVSESNCNELDKMLCRKSCDVC